MFEILHIQYWVRQSRMVMDMNQTLESELERAWASTCRILLGEEIGSLKKYDSWLSEYLPKPSRKKSHISGKDVMLASDRYHANARFVSADEVEMNKKYALGINEIKDIDSIVQVLGEKFEYTGNRHLGNCSFVENSDTVMDSNYVCNSTDVQNSDHIYSSFMIRRMSRNAFGSGYLGEGEFLVRVVGTFNTKRALECYFVPDCSDMYFSHQCFGSHKLMFCFGQRNSSYKIGNLQLEKTKFLELKKKLIGEIAEALKKDGKFPSLMELVPSGEVKVPKINVKRGSETHDMAPIEKGFASAFKVIFGKEPSGSMLDYEKWLERNIVPMNEATTPFGTKTNYPRTFGAFPKYPKGRIVKYDEIMALGSLHLEDGDVQSVKSIASAIGKIAFFSAELYDGKNLNYIDSPLIYHGINAYKTYDLTYGENSGVCFQPLNSKYTYGCRRILESQFAIKCYNSAYLNRCFELDCCNKCSDSYFCHNSEGLQDCMFCFNAKALRYAIGNVEVGKENYLKIKKLVLNEIVRRLESSKSLDYDIYNIGGRK